MHVPWTWDVGWDLSRKIEQKHVEWVVEASVTGLDDDNSQLDLEDFHEWLLDLDGYCPWFACRKNHAVVVVVVVVAEEFVVD